MTSNYATVLWRLQADLRSAMDNGDHGAGALDIREIADFARFCGEEADTRPQSRRGAALVCTEQPIDTSTVAGKAFLDMLGEFAEFETSLRRERQAEGIAKAKAAGVDKGHPATIDPAEVRQLRIEGLGASAIAKRLGIGRASVYRIGKGGDPLFDPTV